MGLGEGGSCVRGRRVDDLDVVRVKGVFGVGGEDRDLIIFAV